MTGCLCCFCVLLFPNERANPVLLHLHIFASELSDEELNAYEAPFPSEEYKVASRHYPQLVPQTDEHMSVEENKGLRSLV